MIDSYERDKKNFINEFVKSLNNGRGALFAGAGLSIPSGGISWSELLREDANAIGVDVSREADLISVAQYIYNESGTRQTITQLLKDKINKSGKINKNHELLSCLPITKAWTTNYDNFLENSFLKIGKVVDVKKSVDDMASETKSTDVTVYKMHGDIGMPNNAVLLKDDYEIYDKKNEVFIKTLQADLLTNTFLFIGFSFDDPNLESILSKVRIMLEGNPRRHYCILKKVNENDPEFKDLDDNKKKTEVEYRLNKQQLRVKDLMRYGIKAILVESYDEITELLKAINRKFLSNKVFISGAYDRIDGFLGKKGQEAKKLADLFCKQLGEALYDNGFEISSGLGIGVGRNLITGVLNKEAASGNTRLSSKLIIRPFPITQNKKQKKEYRKKILSECGVSIFLFGNKWDDNKKNIINSPGVRQEYKIASKLDHFLVPVGATGYISKKLWKEQLQSFDNDFCLSEKYVNLDNNNQNVNQLIKTIMEMLIDYRENPESVRVKKEEL